MVYITPKLDITINLTLVEEEVLLVVEERLQLENLQLTVSCMLVPTSKPTVSRSRAWH